MTQRRAKSIGTWFAGTVAALVPAVAVTAKTMMHITFGVSLMLLSATRAVGQNCCQ